MESPAPKLWRLLRAQREPVKAVWRTLLHGFWWIALKPARYRGGLQFVQYRPRLPFLIGMLAPGVWALHEGLLRRDSALVLFGAVFLIVPLARRPRWFLPVIAPLARVRRTGRTFRIERELRAPISFGEPAAEAIRTWELEMKLPTRTAAWVGIEGEFHLFDMFSKADAGRFAADLNAEIRASIEESSAGYRGEARPTATP
ncbi:MAG: hypothetical protein AAF411_17615 [Myxococcota bacterium]